MATDTISFSLSAFCTGGNHATLTIKQNNVAVTAIPLSWQALKDLDYDNEDLKKILLVLGKEMIKRSTANTKTQVVNEIGTMTITLTY